MADIRERLAQIQRRMNKRNVEGSTDDSDDEGMVEPQRFNTNTNSLRSAARTMDSNDSALPATNTRFTGPSSSIGGDSFAEYKRPLAKYTRHDLSHNNSVTATDPGIGYPYQNQKYGGVENERFLAGGEKRILGQKVNASLDASSLYAVHERIPNARTAARASNSRISTSAVGSDNAPNSNRTLDKLSPRLTPAIGVDCSIELPRSNDGNIENLSSAAMATPLKPAQITPSINLTQQDHMEDIESPMGPLPPLPPPHLASGAKNWSERKIAPKTAVSSASSLRQKFLRPDSAHQRASTLQPNQRAPGTSFGMGHTPLSTRHATVSSVKAPEQHHNAETIRRTVSTSGTSVVNSSARAEIIVNGTKYMVLNLLGKGGSSKVFQVYDDRDRSVKAIKVVDLSECAAVRDAYFNEIALLEQLQDSKRVVKMYDSEHVECEQKLLLVMEKGECDLSTTLRKHSEQDRMPDTVVQFYWIEMLKCVKVIHDHGIVHSDLKPANFLNCCGVLKLIDFGIASSVPTGRTSVTRHCPMGTVSYMSPEVLDGGGDNPSSKCRVPLKSDVWSLGCILYSMVYGKLPFAKYGNPYAKMRAIVDPAVNIEFPDCGNADLLDVLMKCLNRDVSQRPSVDELLQHAYVARIRPQSKSTELDAKTPGKSPATARLPLNESSLKQLCHSLHGMSPNTMHSKLKSAFRM